MSHVTGRVSRALQFFNRLRDAQLAILASLMLFAQPGLAQEHAARSLQGTWLLEKPATVLRAADGKPIPWTAAGRKAYDQNVADLKSGKVADDTKKYCLPDGIPRLLTQPLPFEVVQTDGLVTFLHEAHHVYRVVPLDVAQANPDEANPTFMGNPVGRWDGDTLVIDSIGFNDATRLDAAGMPHSDALHVTEHWRKTDSGQRLRADIQIEDPAMFSRPWMTRLTFVPRPDLTIQEYACGEPHRKPITGRAPK